ncbi:ferredoxin Fer [Halomarina pelagica]|uniref:ferredoxin Fer n=1 Tax=Halomarina pelagica TaxID=2961599 RepID=UPI0020C359DE|nr:ferredoxin Fer [Halomarina sp. BND7]
MSSPFDVLGIDPDADDDEIVEAYRRRVKETHPDQGGSARELRVVLAAYDHVRSGRDGEMPDAESDREATDERQETRVEYLNYEVLDDHGWDLDDDELFEKASSRGLDPADYGRFLVRPHESLLEAAENRGFAWPYACRGGACANCAVAMMDGELAMPVDHILPAEMLDRGIRLSCNGVPVTDELRVVYNVKHRPGLEELRLPPRPFEQAYPKG